jgi:hypothetical protein
MKDKQQLTEGTEKKGGVNNTPVVPKQEIKPPAQKANTTHNILRSVENLWFIWSNEHKAWWGSCHRGYTADVMVAGTYTTNEALEICKGSNIAVATDEVPNETMLPVSCHGLRRRAHDQ